MGQPTIVVHGGAGLWPRPKQKAGLKGVKEAAEQGWDVVAGGGTSVDAVEVAVVSMENDPIFNAGTGSALNLEGVAEMDAAIMNGFDLSCGAIAMVRGVNNPIKLARLVMEQTDHVLIAGRGAERLARGRHLTFTNLVTANRRSAWKAGLSKFKRGEDRHLAKNRKLYQDGVLGRNDTVGALCLDRKGNLAAACSTGGLSLKLSGRIGDSAIIGAGLYADNRLGAATATGIGELAVKTALSKSACDSMRWASANTAAKRSIDNTTRRVGKGVGVLTLDRRGGYGVSHSTPHLCWASRTLSGLRQSMFGTHP